LRYTFVAHVLQNRIVFRKILPWKMFALQFCNKLSCSFLIEMADIAVSVFEFYVVTSVPYFQTKTTNSRPARLVLVCWFKNGDGERWKKLTYNTVKRNLRLFSLKLPPIHFFRGLGSLHYSSLRGEIPHKFRVKHIRKQEIKCVHNFHTSTRNISLCNKIK
jgi:hypothetical protein